MVEMNVKVIESVYYDCTSLFALVFKLNCQYNIIGTPSTEVIVISTLLGAASAILFCVFMILGGTCIYLHVRPQSPRSGVDKVVSRIKYY